MVNMDWCVSCGSLPREFTVGIKNSSRWFLPGAKKNKTVAVNRKSLGCVINICRVHHCSLCLIHWRRRFCFLCVSSVFLLILFLFSEETPVILWCQSPFRSRDPCSTKCLQVSGLKKSLQSYRLPENLRFRLGEFGDKLQECDVALWIIWLFFGENRLFEHCP